MPYKDKDQQRKAQLDWANNRRVEMLAGKTCVLCQAPASYAQGVKTKGKTPFSWTYSKAKIEEKLKTARLLCEDCYLDTVAERMSDLKTTHGHTDSPTYTTWRCMLQRCNSPDATNYRWYGARGVTVDERWDSFENFLADMGTRPDGMTLDRINPHLNYCKDNCRWADAATQGMNKRRRVPEVA